MTASSFKTQNSKFKTPSLTRRELHKLPLRSLHEARNWSKADVLVGEWPPGSGQRIVVKDLKKRPLWYRVLVGRYLLRREWKVLCALRDLPGVPKIIARPDADVIVMEYHEGRKVEDFPDKTLGIEVVRHVEALIAGAHARGVTHGDLHGNNILIADDGRVTLIDWATAIYFGRRPHGAKARLFAEWRALDERAVAKLKILHTPSAVTARERHLLLRGGSRAYRTIKKFRQGLEKLRGQERKVKRLDNAKVRKRLKRHYQGPQHQDQQYQAGEES